ncbi:hypothetical protein M422DRAFT_268475, partial [Sphaerobolus stellatus SS14]
MTSADDPTNHDEMTGTHRHLNINLDRRAAPSAASARAARPSSSSEPAHPIQSTNATSGTSGQDQDGPSSSTGQENPTDGADDGRPIPRTLEKENEKALKQR